MMNIRKKISLMLILTMVGTFFIGLGTAGASATYSAGSLMRVGSGDNQKLGRVRIEVPAEEIRSGDFLTMRLPADFRYNIDSGTLESTADPSKTDFDLDSDPEGHVTFSIPSPKNAFFDRSVSGAVYSSTYIHVDMIADNEMKVRVDPGMVVNNDDETGYFYINLNKVYIDSGAPETIRAYFDGRSGSPFVEDQVELADYESGEVEISIDDIKTITDSLSEIDSLRLEENRAGAWQEGDDLKLKLPGGFEWDSGGSITTLDGDGVIEISDTDGRTLTLTCTHESTSATRWRINDLGIDVEDEDAAKTGEVEINVSGQTDATPGSLTIAEYGDYDVEVDEYGDVPDVIAGAVNQRIGKFTIEESAPESLTPDRSITASLVGGAKWDFTNTEGPRINQSESRHLSDPIEGRNWKIVGHDGREIKMTLGNDYSNRAIKAVFEKGEIAVSPNADSDIKIEFGGTAGVDRTVTVAHVVKAASITTEGGPVETSLGLREVALNPIIISENHKEAINPDRFDDFIDWWNEDDDHDVDHEGDWRTVRVEFPWGIEPGEKGRVEVADGDLVIDEQSLHTEYSSDSASWGIEFDVRSSSSTPSRVRLSGVKLDISRMVPGGDIEAYLKGDAIIKTGDVFPGQTDIGKTPVLTIGSDADRTGETAAISGQFLVGSAQYLINGRPQDMEVVPYVRDGRCFVPVRYLAYILGVTDSNIIWDANTQTVTLIKGDRIVQMKIGSTLLIVNGTAINMELAPEINSSRTFLPVRYVAQAFGALVGWDAATQTVTLQ